MFKHQKNQQQQQHQQQQQKPQPSRAWQDDDDNDYSLSSKNPSSYQPQPKFLRHQQQQQFQPQSRSNQYSDPPKRLDTFPLEQKLVNDILQPTGISIKPSEHLLSDFYKRARNLDREKIFNTILERLMNYESYVTNQDQVKMLTKCLYLVEYLVMYKLDDIYEAFEERIELFENIKGEYPTNKKVNDICNNIIKVYMPNEVNTKMQQHQQDVRNVGKSNVNLLDIDTGDDDNSATVSGCGNANLLDGIFGNANSNNIQQEQEQGSGFDNIFSNDNNTNNVTNTDVNKDSNNKPKKFNFIKDKSGNDSNNTPQMITIEQKKKTFDFIKNKTPTVVHSQPPIQSDLNDIFSSTFPSTTNTTTNIISNSGNTIDLTKIQFIKPEEPKFNYEHVYENTDVLKDKTEKDPFNFVNDMIKSKK